MAARLLVRASGDPFASFLGIGLKSVGGRPLRGGASGRFANPLDLDPGGLNARRVLPARGR